MELRNNGLLEKHVVDVLKEKKLTITTAESCTGGMISSRIVNVPGASAVLKQAYVTSVSYTHLTLPTNSLV